MSIKVIDGDLFDTTAPIICHQVNCQCRMGSGVAKQVREKYPIAYRQYMNLCTDKGSNPDALLGTAQFVYGTDKIIVNMFAQNKYGYDKALYTTSQSPPARPQAILYGMAIVSPGATCFAIFFR